MRVITEAIVPNQWNEALLVLRDDVRTWCPPGGVLAAGELPDAGVVRGVREETGVQVYPVRLVGLTYTPARTSQLVLTFRCIQSGGEPNTSDEVLQAAFLPVSPLPKPMLAMHRQRLVQGLHHAGGPPKWNASTLPWYIRLSRPVFNRYLDVRDRITGRTDTVPPDWKTGAFTIIQDEAGRVLWVKRRDHAVWNLPGGAGSNGEAPWVTAVRETREETGLEVTITDLSGIYVKSGNKMVFVFRATPTRGALAPNEEAAEFAYFAPGSEPANSLEKHISRVADATGPGDITLFRRQDEPATALNLLVQRGAEAG
jgi:ADP-ribose pyrophosphatase YjhB (NUDIX family)